MRDVENPGRSARRFTASRLGFRRAASAQQPASSLSSRSSSSSSSRTPPVAPWSSSSSSSSSSLLLSRAHYTPAAPGTSMRPSRDGGAQSTNPHFFSPELLFSLFFFFLLLVGARERERREREREPRFAYIRGSPDTRGSSRARARTYTDI